MLDNTGELDCKIHARDATRAERDYARSVGARNELFTRPT